MTFRDLEQSVFCRTLHCRIARTLIDPTTLNTNIAIRTDMDLPGYDTDLNVYVDHSGQVLFLDWQMHIPDELKGRHADFLRLLQLFAPTQVARVDAETLSHLKSPERFDDREVDSYDYSVQHPKLSPHHPALGQFGFDVSLRRKDFEALDTLDAAAVRAVGFDKALRAPTTSYFRSCTCGNVFWTGRADDYGSFAAQGTLRTSSTSGSRFLSFVVDPEIFGTAPVEWFVKRHPEWMHAGKLHFPIGVIDGKTIHSTAYIPRDDTAFLLQKADTGADVVLSLYVPKCDASAPLPPQPLEYTPACFLR